MENRSKTEGQGLLELLLVILRHIRVLTAVPLAVGAIAFAIAYFKPPSYTSEAILSMTETSAKQAAMIISTPLVLDTVIQQQGMAKDLPLKDAREVLSSRIRAKPGKDGLLWLQVSAETPLQAQVLANAVIDAWRMTTIPGAQEQTELRERLLYVKKTLKSIEELMTRLTSESPSYFDGQVSRGDRGLTLVSLGELQSRYFSEAQSIPRTLQGVSRDVVKHPPSLPPRADPAGKAKFAVLMTVSAFMLMLIGALLRHLLVQALRAPRNAATMARLRSALRSSAKPAPAQAATPRG